MYLVVGLGNPGKKYEKTRHNMGFMVIDRLAEMTGTAVDRLKFRALTGECIIGGEKVMLMKPQTFMNLSGDAVREAAGFFKLAPSHIRVNAVAPGVIDTDMNACYSEDTLRMLAEKTPLGRLGTPEEIASCVCFLAEDATFLTGQVLTADGGFLL